MRIHFASVLAVLLATRAAAAEPGIPFDFSRHELAIEATIKGAKVHALLDTGVDPSAIDLELAKSLGLKVEMKSAGEISGVGNERGPAAHAATIAGLAIGGQDFAPFDAITTDMSGLSAKYGSRLDVILGFSFFDRKVILIDYPNHTVEIQDGAGSHAPEFPACRKRWSAPLRFLKDENWPLITNFRFGRASAPVSLDTGANGDVWLLRAALKLPGMKSALTNKGVTSSSGLRGSARWQSYTLNEPIGFGPFNLPPGENVTVRDEEGSLNTRVANVGNRQFAALGVKMLLNYRDRQVGFFGDCE